MAVTVSLVLCACSCATNGPPEGSAPSGLLAQVSSGLEQQLTTVRSAIGTGSEPPPQVAAFEPMSPALMAQPAAATSAGPSPLLALNATAPALTEALESALSRLAEQRAENTRLRAATAELQQRLLERDSILARLQQDLSECDSKIDEAHQALSKWQQDVLGFRDEMRQAEEAELEVLQEVLALLKSFKKEKELE